MPDTNPFQCRHLFTDGHQCGSPALRGEPLCFYHQAGRRPSATRTHFNHPIIDLPAPGDFHAIQHALGEVLRLLCEDELEPRRANALLRCLGAASANLARIHRRDRHRDQTHPATPVTDFVNHPDLGSLAIPVQTPPQQNQDFRTSEENFPAHPGSCSPDASAGSASTPAPKPLPSPILHRTPPPPRQPPAAPPTLNDQYVLAERDHRLDARARRETLRAIADQLVIPKSVFSPTESRL